MSTMTLEQAIASAEVRNEMRGDSGRYPNGEGWGHCYGVDGYWLPKDAWILLKAHLAQPAQAVDVHDLCHELYAMAQGPRPISEAVTAMEGRLTRALSGEKAGQTLADFVNLPDADRVAVGQQVAAAVDVAMGEKAGPVDGWLPIETAPQNGTRVLLWVDQTCRVGSWKYFPADAQNPCAPTHWMPLPASPAPDKEG